MSSPQKACQLPEKFSCYPKEDDFGTRVSGSIASTDYSSSSSASSTYSSSHPHLPTKRSEIGNSERNTIEDSERHSTGSFKRNISGRQNIECRPTALLADRRNSVSAECTPLLDFALFKPRVIPKVDDTRIRIEDALHKCFLFKSLDKEQTQIVVNAAKEVSYAKGDIIIRQGDPGDHFFMLEKGTCDVWIKRSDDKNARMVKRYSTGDSFGELALLYNAPRAATIKTLDRHERSAIADVLVAEYFVEGEDIIVEGEPGDKMYFLENGKAEAICKGKRVMEYGRGDYFGELALLNSQPRAASVTSVTPCKCVSIDRDSFKRLLGKVEDILNRNKNLYQTFRDDDDEKEKDNFAEEEDKKHETSINDADNKDKKHETSGSDGCLKEEDKKHETCGSDGSGKEEDKHHV